MYNQRTCQIRQSSLEQVDNLSSFHPNYNQKQTTLQHHVYDMIMTAIALKIKLLQRRFSCKLVGRCVCNFSLSMTMLTLQRMKFRIYRIRIVACSDCHGRRLHLGDRGILAMNSCWTFTCYELGYICNLHVRRFCNL